MQRTPHDLDLSILYDFHMAFSSSIHGQRIDITFSQHIDIPSDEIDILALVMSWFTVIEQKQTIYG